MANDAAADSGLPYDSGPHAVLDVLTFRAIVCAILLGSAVCLANMYFGLQAGMVAGMPMQSALLAFALFRGIQHRLAKPLSPQETTIIEVIAGTLGLAPFNAGFTGFIPALQFLLTREEFGPIVFGLKRLIFWSLATLGLGIVVAAPFREMFILRERLRFPSATATGTLIGVLFGKDTVIARVDQGPTSRSNGTSQEAEPLIEEHQDRRDSSEEVQLSETVGSGTEPPDHVEKVLSTLGLSLLGSFTFGLVSFFAPILRSIPIFGMKAAKEWLWTYDLSPAYFGYGIIIGPSVNAHILMGAIIGWGILSPVAKAKGWAPGPIDDWEKGPRGWIIWAGLGLILGDCLVGLVLPAIRVLALHGLNKLKEACSGQWFQQRITFQQNPDASQQAAVDAKPVQDKWSREASVTKPLLLWSAFVVLVLYFGVLSTEFRHLVTPLATLVAILLLPSMALISIRSLGETDNGSSLAIERIAQLVIGGLVPCCQSSYMSANLLLAGAVEAGAFQASQHTGALKTAYMTGTAPRAIYYAQSIGSVAGALLASVIYYAYVSVKEIPSSEFGIPDAHLWLVAARFIHQQGLPAKAFKCSILAFGTGICLGVLRITFKGVWWRDLIPSGVALSIGMYTVPAISLAQAAGSLALIVARDLYGVQYFLLLCAATGLILGQGLFSIVALILSASGVASC